MQNRSPVRLLLASSLLVLSACKTVGSGPPVPNDEGLKAFPTARTYDPPGRIFRKDRSGAIFGVAQLPITNASCGGEESFPSHKSNAELSLGMVLESIGVAQDALPANASLNLSNKHDVEIESVAGRRECVDDSDVDPVVSQIASFFEENGIVARPDNDYFLIRETVSTTRLKYTASKTWLAGAEAEAQLRGAVSGKATFKYEDGDTFSMDRTFATPMRIWYKAERLAIRPASGVGPGQVEVTTRGIAGDFEAPVNSTLNAP